MRTKWWIRKTFRRWDLFINRDTNTAERGDRAEKSDRRLFFGFELPADVREQLADLQARLKIGCRFVDAHPRWVEVENLHLTLLFLGSVDEEHIGEILQAADAIAGEIPSLELVVARLGLFPPDSKEPKVLSVDVRATDKGLQKLYARLSGAMRDLGLHLEDRPYKPHLTLARITSIKTGSRLAPLATSHANKIKAQFSVREMVLFQSQLKPESPTYHAIHKSVLSL